MKIHKKVYHLQMSKNGNFKKLVLNLSQSMNSRKTQGVIKYKKFKRIKIMP